jgi:hypothetical protein
LLGGHCTLLSGSWCCDQQKQDRGQLQPR